MADFLLVRIVVAALPGNDARPNDHQGRQHLSLSRDDVALAIGANRRRCGEGLLFVVRQCREYWYGLYKVDRRDCAEDLPSLRLGKSFMTIDEEGGIASSKPADLEWR